MVQWARMGMAGRGAAVSAGSRGSAGELGTRGRAAWRRLNATASAPLPARPGTDRGDPAGTEGGARAGGRGQGRGREAPVGVGGALPVPRAGARDPSRDRSRREALTGCRCPRCPGSGAAPR